MFTASGRIRSERTTRDTRATALIVAALLFANATALFGLTASARAGDFPDALHYAPMTWEKQAPIPEARPRAPESPAAPAHAVKAPAPVTHKPLDPVTTRSTARQFSEVRAVRFASWAGRHHRFWLIGFMTIALGVMASVSIFMFRSLARDISENERRRNRF
ncbi:MAG: hypothetical protein Kow0026_14820 [Oricola sp.]